MTFSLSTEQIRGAVRKANHDQYMTMYGVKITVLHGEEAEEFIYWNSNPIKPQVHSAMVDGILPKDVGKVLD